MHWTKLNPFPFSGCFKNIVLFHHSLSFSLLLNQYKKSHSTVQKSVYFICITSAYYGAKRFSVILYKIANIYKHVQHYEVIILVGRGQIK